jgi:hypothetical protein
MSNTYGAMGASPNTAGMYAQTCQHCGTTYASYCSSSSYCPTCNPQMAGYGASVASPSHSHGYSATPYTNDSPPALLRMIGMRLRRAEGASLGFEQLYPVRSGEKVCTMVIQDGVAQIIEDEWVLFPSDRFITQLRLLEK